MFLNIRTFVLALFISSTAFAQQTETTKIDSLGPGKNIGNISFGPYFPIAFGDNFANNGLDLKMGARFSFKIKTTKDIYVGPYFSFFKSNVSDPELIGNYFRSNNYLVGGMVNYEKHIGDFDASIGIGVGYSTYRNHATGDNFSDTATAVWLNPELSYRFSNYLGVYASTELRHDFMNVNVPKELKDTFNGANYLNISFGLRINLGTAHKYM